MTEQSRNDLKIAGSTTVAGGVFDKVTIAGQAEINGDLDCLEFKVSGSSDIKGNLKAETIKISGRAAIAGNLWSKEAKISGHLATRGDLSVKKICISGHAEITGNVSAELIDVRGYLTTKGDCEAESLVAMGTVVVDGMLNAGNIDIKLYGNSRAREIGGENISIRSHVAFGLHRLMKIFYSPGKFTAETIEGDDIHLEQVRAKVVRGNNVTIGSGCQVDLVEYRDSIERDEDSQVNEVKRRVHVVGIFP